MGAAATAATAVAAAIASVRPQARAVGGINVPAEAARGAPSEAGRKEGRVRASGWAGSGGVRAGGDVGTARSSNQTAGVGCGDGGGGMGTLNYAATLGLTCRHAYLVYMASPIDIHIVDDISKSKN